MKAKDKIEDQQSYNHFMPKSILKLGWGFKNDQKNINVKVLEYDKLKKFIKNNPDFTKKELDDAFYKSYCDSKGMIVNRSAESIMGNELVFDILEKKFTTDNIDIELNIERVMKEAIEFDKVEYSDIFNIYNWFSLQKCRASSDLMAIYSCYLKLYNISKVNSVEEYVDFKIFYNNKISNHFTSYKNSYINNQYKVSLIEFKLDRSREFFFCLGSLNTINGKAFKDIYYEYESYLNTIGVTFNEDVISLFNLVDISIISSNKALFVYHPYFEKYIEKFKYLIATCWNAYMIGIENNILIISPYFNCNTTTVIDTIFSQKENNQLQYNLNLNNDYLELLESSKNFEKLIKYSKK